eukprot:jgi/Mesen1/263/ME1145127C09482
MAKYLGRLFNRIFRGSHEHDDETDSSQFPAEQERVGGGFAVKRAVPSGKTREVGPVVREVEGGQGGVQGLTWYSQQLSVDEDGDVAQEFLKEVVPEQQQPGGVGTGATSPHLEAVRRPQLRPVKAEAPISTRNGNLNLTVEPSGSRSPT